MVTILILYTELMPYNVVVIRELVKKKCRVHVVLQDTDKKTPYLPPLLEGVTYYNRSTFWSPDHLFRLVKKWNQIWFGQPVGSILCIMRLPV